MKIKFSNGRELPIIMCYNNGKKYINGETRNCRDIVLADGVIGLDTLKALLTNSDNLSVIEVTMNYTDENGELKTDTEVLENFVYAAEIKDKLNGEIWFTIGQKTALEIENEEALRVIDELLIAMEV
ncbi:MAG: hypothetical protein IKY90_04285 [Oscillospiraceae bacterium]|nr:hypothetical protein [Oscillospiraceae bacterium]